MHCELQGFFRYLLEFLFKGQGYGLLRGRGSIHGLQKAQKDS